MREEAKRVYSSVLNEADIARRKLERARLEYKEREKEMETFNEAQLGYEILTSKANRASQMYQQVLAKMKEFDLNSKDTVQNMTIIDRATPPLKHIRPNRVLVLLGGLVGGLATALALAFFVNYLDDSIKSQEDVETYLRVNFLGYIPNIKSTSVVER